MCSWAGMQLPLLNEDPRHCGPKGGVGERGGGVRNGRRMKMERGHGREEI